MAAPVLPVPETLLLPSTSGAFTTGGGGGATTVTSVEKALATWATVCRAFTVVPATRGATARLQVPVPPTAVVPTERSAIKTSTMARGVPMPTTLVFPSTRGAVTEGVGGMATSEMGADGALVRPATICVALAG